MRQKPKTKQLVQLYYQPKQQELLHQQEQLELKYRSIVEASYIERSAASAVKSARTSYKNLKILQKNQSALFWKLQFIKTAKN